MPIQPNFLERTLFYQLNLAPAPLLDLAGALAWQTVAAGVRLGIFQALQQRPLTPAEVATKLNTKLRGTQALLRALATIGYLKQEGDRYANSTMTVKWLLDDTLDMDAAVSYWGTALQELWPYSTEIIRTGERPFNFYEWLESRAEMSEAFQKMMIANVNLAGPDIVSKVNLPDSAERLLDVGGGHGMFSVLFCQRYPDLQASVLDSPTALETARQIVSQNGLVDRIKLRPGDLWQDDWGQGYDAVLLFNLLHHFDLETNQKLLKMTASALKPGGQVAILEQVEGKVSGAASNAFIQLVALQYHLFVDGRVFSRDDISGLLTSTDFDEIQFHALAKSPGTSLVTARKVT